MRGTYIQYLLLFKNNLVSSHLSRGEYVLNPFIIYDSVSEGYNQRNVSTVLLLLNCNTIDNSVCIVNGNDSTNL